MDVQGGEWTFIGSTWNEHAEHTFPHCALRTPRLPQRVMGWSMLKMAQQGRIPRGAGRCAQTRQPRHESMFAEYHCGGIGMAAGINAAYSLLARFLN